MKSLLCKSILIAVFVLTSCSTSNIRFDPETEKNDYLVYYTRNSSKQGLMLYVPGKNVRTKILLDWQIEEFSLSTKNQLAFSSSQDGNSKIYIVDYPFKENVPIEIPMELSSKIYPLSWSPDGRYLLFESVQEGKKTLSLWDGTNVSDVFDYYGRTGEVTWSAQAHMAFSLYYDRDPLDGALSEMFIWDGHTILPVSQDPSDRDRYPAWSKDGKLAFLSDRNGQSDIFVWDGISKIDGVPDANSFTNVAPHLAQYHSYPAWTSSGSLAFEGLAAESSYTQIYEWDGQTITNLSQNPSLHNGGQTWRSDGYWAFVSYAGERHDLSIRDATNRTILTTKGQYSPAWSQHGLLAFCSYDYPDWTLSVWNGLKVIEVVHDAHYIVAEWNNGEELWCMEY